MLVSKWEQSLRDTLTIRVRSELQWLVANDVESRIWDSRERAAIKVCSSHWRITASNLQNPLFCKKQCEFCRNFVCVSCLLSIPTATSAKLQ